MIGQDNIFRPKSKTGLSGRLTRFFLLLSPYIWPTKCQYIYTSIHFVFVAYSGFSRQLFKIHLFPITNLNCLSSTLHCLRNEENCCWIKEDEHVLKCFTYRDIGKNDFVQTLFISQDSDNAANSGNCMNFFVPRQQLSTRAFRRSFKTPVEIFHQDVQLITVKSISSLLYLG